MLFQVVIQCYVPADGVKFSKHSSCLSRLQTQGMIVHYYCSNIALHCRSGKWWNAGTGTQPEPQQASGLWHEGYHCGGQAVNWPLLSHKCRGALNLFSLQQTASCLERIACPIQQKGLLERNPVRSWRLLLRQAHGTCKMLPVEVERLVCTYRPSHNQQGMLS